MPFWELTVPTSADVSEGLTNFLWEQGALGVVEEETPGALPRLRAFFPEATSSTALCRAVGDYLASLTALGLAVNGAEPRVAPLLDEPWAEAWRQAFAPQRVGRRLLIVPPWERPAADHGLTTIVIEPGRAFGTGTHGSTQGCLLLLDALLERITPARALDIGTGSGILAIAAAALGVLEVTALDTDPDAVAAAEANALRNGVRERIGCALVDTGGVEGPAFPLILANLLAGSHITHTPEYRRLLSPGGHLILGGIVSDEADSVGQALAERGLTLAERTDVDGWASLRFTG
ncbi:MAG: 50S ribosomal protein L11 methylase, ribosomal protein L11 methyltransferase [Candidatus Rokubacteria bacterium CSP1-6]|nr:MAG: 50S ribosomal protein L11 methylase, ribosomal protein L11 methyltransferase [Candidatus Rokubacteria bacterium CSP1-6]